MLDQLKIGNLTNILTCLFSEKRLTKAQLVRLTGLSNSTVSSAVNSLLKLKLLVGDGYGESIGGRRSEIYRLNKAYGRFIGVDMCANGFYVVVTDCENTVLTQFFDLYDNRVPKIHFLLGVLEKVIKQFPGVLGIGIGLAAHIDFSEQIVIDCPDVCWSQVHLKEIIERHFMIFTYIDHRVNAAAIREGLLGYAADIKNYLFFYENSPDKAALVLNGGICRGHTNYNGKWEDSYGLTGKVRLLSELFDVERIFIAYKTQAYKAQWKNDLPQSVVCFEAKKNMCALGAAAVVQKEWFRSIYFML